jgi:hypothetical protein
LIAWISWFAPLNRGNYPLAFVSIKCLTTNSVAECAGFIAHTLFMSTRGMKSAESPLPVEISMDISAPLPAIVGFTEVAP